MFTRARPPGLWIPGSVIAQAELEHLDDYYLALDSAGGTYALGAALILGGAGVTLSGTSHHVAGTLTVDSLALISIANGGSIKAEGTGTADITLAVVTNVATLTVGATGVVQMGGALNVLANGLVNVKSLGGVVVESGGTVLVQSGGIIQGDAGSLIRVFGGLTIEDSTGVLTLEAGTTNFNAGTLSHLATSVNSYTSGAEETGTVTDARTTSRTGKTMRTGAGARQAGRTARLLADASEDVTVADDTVRVRQTMTGVHVYTLRHTGTVPTAGEKIHSYRSGTTTPSAHGATFAREDGTIVFSYAASKQGFATFEFDGSDWQLVGPWGLYSSGDNSGAYGNVW